MTLVSGLCLRLERLQLVAVSLLQTFRGDGELCGLR